MGTYCYARALNKDGDEVGDIEFYGYDVMAWLGNSARNYSGITEFDKIKLGAPKGFDTERYDYNGTCFKHVDIDELLAANYDRLVVEKRHTGSLSENPSDWKEKSLREFLGDGYFDELNAAKAAGAVTIVYWFD
jgi:hypothetical protein